MYVSSFICLLCVGNFSLHLKKRFWSYIYLGECPKIEYGHHFHGNQTRDFFFICSPSFFILIIINIQWNDWAEKWAKQFLDQHPPPPSPKGEGTVGGGDTKPNSLGTTGQTHWPTHRSGKRCSWTRRITVWSITEVTLTVIFDRSVDAYLRLSVEDELSERVDAVSLQMHLFHFGAVQHVHKRLQQHFNIYNLKTHFWYTEESTCMSHDC